MTVGVALIKNDADAGSILNHRKLRAFSWVSREPHFASGRELHRMSASPYAH
jgi:hypothetical protein